MGKKKKLPAVKPPFHFVFEGIWFLMYNTENVKSILRSSLKYCLSKNNKVCQLNIWSCYRVQICLISIIRTHSAVLRCVSE